ncbi:MAG: hypothetical protein AAGI07_09295 [Bacteroidota bacterium]
MPTKEIREREVLELIKERNDKQIKINWKFSITDTRRKMNRHYAKVNPINTKQ